MQHTWTAGRTAKRLSREEMGVAFHLAERDVTVSIPFHIQEWNLVIQFFMEVKVIHLT